MKNILTHTIYLLAIVLFSGTVSAQSEFSKFDNQDNISAVVVNKKMFEMMGNVKLDTSNAENQAYLNLIKKLDNLKVYSTKNSKSSSDLKAEAASYVAAKKMDELMTVTDQGANAKIYVNSGANNSNISQLLLVNDGSGQAETVLLLLNGSFSLNEISALTDKMKLPGGSALKKASNK